jgi:hypothetical protein
MVNRTILSKAVGKRCAFTVLIAAGLLSLGASSHAENKCPWLNEATASGFLGGDSVGAFTAAMDGKPAVCVFTQSGTQSGAPMRVLRITVEVVQAPHDRYTQAVQNCGATPLELRAIGNEAIECFVEDRKGGSTARVVSRVRDQLFTITISTAMKNDPILDRDALKAKIGVAAEQVAGNLF